VAVDTLGRRLARSAVAQAGCSQSITHGVAIWKTFLAC